MADAGRQLTAYEVRCHHCDVSFPPGTKQCIHCGERIGRPRLVLGRGGEMPDFAGGEAFPEAEMEEAEVGGGRKLRLGFTAVWVVLAILSALAQRCQSGG
jgi:hypothetical protein